jgi:hypothetical protein
MSNNNKKKKGTTTTGNEQVDNDLNTPLINKQDQEVSLGTSSFSASNSEATGMNYSGSQPPGQLTQIIRKEGDQPSLELSSILKD